VSKIFDIFSKEFQEYALTLTKHHWNFQRLKDGSYRCVVDNCPFGREYGFWTCEFHRKLELENFNPCDDLGTLIWSHRGKEEICGG